MSIFIGLLVVVSIFVIGGLLNKWKFDSAFNDPFDKE